MKLTAKEFRDWEHKRVTLVGMTGVGKTRVASILRRHQWFHYSAAYRIGTRYLNEPILDNIKKQTMQVPFLRDLLRSDSIHISNNITVDNLNPVTTFLGKLGDPEQGGLSDEEFKRRQKLYRKALAAAMRDVPGFISKAQRIYGYKHFVNDTAGSVCELNRPDLIEQLAEHTLILYIRPTEKEEEDLLRQVDQALRPLCYREQFLDAQLNAYLRERGLSYVAEIEPGNFYRWVLPTLYSDRVKRYEEIASRHGYTVAMDEFNSVRSEADFLRVTETALERDA